jgi:hypothetical protein
MKHTLSTVAKFSAVMEPEDALYHSYNGHYSEPDEYRKF